MLITSHSKEFKNYAIPQSFKDFVNLEKYPIPNLGILLSYIKKNHLLKTKQNKLKNCTTVNKRYFSPDFHKLLFFFL